MKQVIILIAMIAVGLVLFSGIYGLQGNASSVVSQSYGQAISRGSAINSLAPQTSNWGYYENYRD